ncbi:MBL fold metallo-hydrolase [Fibrisoma limi]|nr:MBL fold metallo-hydrolase [Fibrisoma limi]
MLKPAFQKDDALLADLKAAAGHPEQLHIWWLGQSGFLLQYVGRRLLFDPYLSDSLTRKYAATDKPHVRMSEPVIDPAKLTGLEVITSSHNHTDHLDAETLCPLFEANPNAQFVIPEANRAFVADRLGCDPDWPIGLTSGQTTTVGGFVIHGVPAAHNDLAVDTKGHNLYMGFVVELGPYKVYHSGDTLWFDGLENLLRPFAVDVAFLPINGNKPERRVAGNLNPDEAARLGRDIGAKVTIPHHYDLFEFNTADPAEFVQACNQHGTPYHVLRLGERMTIGQAVE